MAVALSSSATMYLRIRQLIDREDTAYFTDAEIEEFLESAVDEFIHQYYGVFEVNQEVRDKLQSLVNKTTASFPASTLEYNLTDIDAAYMRLLSATLTNDPKTRVKIIQLSDLSAYLSDPFNKATDDSPVIYIKGSKLHILGPSKKTDVDVYWLKYTNTFSDLPDHTYEELCNITARKILATLGDPRYEIQSREITTERRG